MVPTAEVDPETFHIGATQGDNLDSMSDPITAQDDLTQRRIATSVAWTKPENWDGDQWVGSTLPPWGNKPRCKAVRNGEQCHKAVIPGGVVCGTHGGAAPQVKRRAKLRVLQLLDPAYGQLARILANPDDQRIGLQAITLVAKLNGMLDTARSDVDPSLAKAIIMDRHFAIQKEAQKQLDEMLNGEIIEDAVEVSETGEEQVTGLVSTVLDEDGDPADMRTQEEIDDDDELLYDPAAAADFAAAERAAFVANAQAELMVAAGEVADSAGDDDADPADPGPDDEPIVTFLPHRPAAAAVTITATTETDPSATLS